MKKILLVTGLLITMFSYVSTNVSKADEVITGYHFKGNGWQSDLDCFKANFKQDSLTSVSLIPTPELNLAINNQLNKLINSNDFVKNTTIAKQTLIAVLKKVKKQMNEKPANGKQATILLSGQRYHRLSGEDGCGNVLLTGYYTPSLKLKRKADAVYRFPLYKKPTHWPNKKQLTRKQIDTDKGLQGLGLEIGYSASLLSNYLAQVQGSTYAHFIDTNEFVTLAFAGKNGKKYQSLGKYLVAQKYIEKKDISLSAIRDYFAKNPNKLTGMLSINPSYVFFTQVNTPPITSSGVPALTGVTAAVDPNYIPYGSVLLVEYPVLNKAGEVVNRRYQLVIASDSGSAIKGKGHIDLYLGKNRKTAGKLHHYGQVWLLTE